MWTQGSVVSSSVVNQLLTEMDGLESRSCLLLAATNRPDILDPAILRPGRFDKIVFVGFPSAEDRYDILKTITKVSARPYCARDGRLAVNAFLSVCYFVVRYQFRPHRMERDRDARSTLISNKLQPTEDATAIRELTCRRWLEKRLPRR